MHVCRTYLSRHLWLLFLQKIIWRVIVKAFNYTGCADDFLAVIADGVELGHTRKINTSVSVFVPQGTKVLGIRCEP